MGMKSGSTKAKAATGRPFVKGDARINRTQGPRNAEAASYTIQARNHAPKKITPEKFVDLLAERVLKGIPWAVAMWADLFFEKQTNQHDVQVSFHIIDHVVKTESE